MALLNSCGHCWSASQCPVRFHEIVIRKVPAEGKGGMQSSVCPPTTEWVNSLNLIHVVFADHTNIVNLWHHYYDELYSQTPNPSRVQAREHTYLQMLSEMARVLGYKRLQQTDIDK